MITASVGTAACASRYATDFQQKSEASMRAKFLVPSLLAIAAATPASAQSVISRSIATEPVETVVTQTPTGTIVTRRPLDDTIAAPAPVVTAVPNSIDAITTREVV